MFRSSWCWTTPATWTRFDLAWFVRDRISISSAHPGRPRSLGDWAVNSLVSNRPPACNSKLAETTPGDLNLSWALHFTPWKALPIFNLHAIMAYQKGVCNCQKITKPKYTTFSKPLRLTPGKEGGKKKKSKEREQSKFLLKGRCCRNVAILLLSYKQTFKSQLVTFLSLYTYLDYVSLSSSSLGIKSQALGGALLPSSWEIGCCSYLTLSCFWM